MIDRILQFLNWLMGRMPPVRIGPAKHGRGLFASRRIRAGECLGEVHGVIIDDADYGSNYCIDIGATYSLEPDEPFRFMNHSCEPNCKLFLISHSNQPDQQQRRVVVEALVDIAPGTELTIDYAWPAHSAIPCGCGSRNCRGWIVAPHELHQVQGAQPQAL